MVQIRLLGGVGAVTGAGEPVDVGPAKCQAVLAALALSAGSAVPVTRLVELVWGAEAPRTAEKTLQTYVARLRKVLGPDVIVRTGGAYRLDVDAGSVDVRRFQNHLDSGDIAAALAEWTGDPLAGLDTGGFSAVENRLIEQWLGALEIDLERRLETDTPAAIGLLTELTVSYPYREGLWALLMTGLYRTGRQGDALAAYRRARRHLVEQLGVEPGPRLRELESLVLGQDEQLGFDGTSTPRGSSLPLGTVTFGFADVDGAAGLWVTRKQEMAAAMARHEEIVREATSAHGGYVFASGGDSFGAAFHRTSDATAWATQLQVALSEEGWPGGIEIRPRIGLHTGEAEERGNDYFGPAVNVAARLATIGHGGQTLLSGTTSTMVDQADLRELGIFRLDGVIADQRVFQLGDAEHPPLRTDRSGQGHLPRRIGRLIGRDEDLEAVGDALTSAPVVTLVGPGGIGKTCLALAAARVVDVELGGRVWLIELAGIATSDEVPRAVADTLDVQENPARTLTQSIVSVLQSRQTLLVLDNCEHVIDGAADLVRTIVEGCPGVRVLATSREGLGLAEEQIVVVAPLEPAGAAVELFVERAAAADRTFDHQTYRNDIEEICRRLDGVPLAIELAAARARSLPPPDLLQRLDDHLRLLTGGRRTGVERHRTLRATIQWSYDLLTPLEQMLYRRLSIFAGPFDLSAAETVAAEEGLDAVEIDALLEGLLNRSMLIVESGLFGRRFRLLETMRQYASERLSENGHTDLIAKRHAHWCLDEVTHIQHLLAGRAEIEGVARLNDLWPNLRAAIDWTCATRHRGLARALIDPIAAEILLRSQSEICDWVERILAITPSDDEETIVFGLTLAAHRYMQNRDLEAYERLTERYGEPDHPMVGYARAFVTDNEEQLADLAPGAVIEWRRQGQNLMAAIAELWIGGALLNTGRFEEHDAFVTALADRFRAHGPPTLLNWTLVILGFSATFQGNHQVADQFFEEAVDVDIPDHTNSLNKPIEARAALRRGNQTEAFQLLHSFVDELLDNDNMSGAGFACIEFINTMAAVNRLHEAARMLGHLEATGMLNVEPAAFKTLVADTAARIAADTTQALDSEQAIGRDLDQHQALGFMSDVLGRLAG